jgi:AcrR family transcriptional regulator
MSRSHHGTATRRGDGYHHGDLRRALIEAGREILAEKGLDSLSLREVARRANVSQAAPYHHFADKAELVGAIVESGFGELTEELRSGALEEGGSSLEHLAGMGLAYVRFAVSNPGLFRLLFRPELRNGTESGPVAKAMETAGSASYQVFLNTVREALQKGPVVGSVEDVALAAWSIVHGLATLLVDGPVDIGERPPEELARVVLLALGNGITGRGKS